MVRHYKVKREGPKYVIDVEEPVSPGVRSREVHRWGRRHFPRRANRTPYPPPVRLRLTPSSGRLFRVANQEGAGAFPAG